METIEERARRQEKSQFSEEEYQILHNQRGINSPFGIGYYLGATEQQKIDAIKFSTAFCDMTCGEEKRKSCDENCKSCALIAKFLQLGIKHP